MFLDAKFNEPHMTNDVKSNNKNRSVKSDEQKTETFLVSLNQIGLAVLLAENLSRV